MKKSSFRYKCSSASLDPKVVRCVVEVEPALANKYLRKGKKVTCPKCGSPMIRIKTKVR